MIPTLRNSGLKGKVVLIASQRSGKCIPSDLVQAFLAEEAIVYATDINREVLKIVETEVEHFLSMKITTYPLDFHKPGQIDGFVQKIKEKEGRIDILVTEMNDNNSCTGRLVKVFVRSDCKLQHQ